MTPRKLQEIVAQCVSIMIFYHNCGLTPRSMRLLKAEIRDIASMVSQMAHPDEQVGRIDLWVSKELYTRYESELAARLFTLFVQAYKAGMPIEVHA